MGFFDRWTRKNLPSAAANLSKRNANKYNRAVNANARTARARAEAAARANARSNTFRSLKRRLQGYGSMSEVEIEASKTVKEITKLQESATARIAKLRAISKEVEGVKDALADARDKLDTGVKLIEKISKDMPDNSNEGRINDMQDAIDDLSRGDDSCEKQVKEVTDDLDKVITDLGRILPLCLDKHRRLTQNQFDLITAIKRRVKAEPAKPTKEQIAKELANERAARLRRAMGKPPNNSVLNLLK
jgi:division protein CdvB (Snf7/Vps24/ESCRT-III family)